MASALPLEGSSPKLHVICDNEALVEVEASLAKVSHILKALLNDASTPKPETSTSLDEDPVASESVSSKPKSKKHIFQFQKSEKKTQQTVSENSPERSLSLPSAQAGGEEKKGESEVEADTVEFPVDEISQKMSAIKITGAKSSSEPEQAASKTVCDEPTASAASTEEPSAFPTSGNSPSESKDYLNNDILQQRSRNILQASEYLKRSTEIGLEDLTSESAKELAQLATVDLEPRITETLNKPPQPSASGSMPELQQQPGQPSSTTNPEHAEPYEQGSGAGPGIETTVVEAVQESGARPDVEKNVVEATPELPKQVRAPKGVTDKGMQHVVRWWDCHKAFDPQEEPNKMIVKLPDWDQAYFSYLYNTSRSEFFQMLEASGLMEIPILLNRMCKFIVDHIKDLSAERMMEYFTVKSRSEEIMSEYASRSSIQAEHSSGAEPSSPGRGTPSPAKTKRQTPPKPKRKVPTTTL